MKFFETSLILLIHGSFPSYTNIYRTVCSCLSHMRFASFRSMLKMWIVVFVSIHLNNETKHKICSQYNIANISFSFKVCSVKMRFAGERLQLTSINNILRGFWFKSENVCLLFYLYEISCVDLFIVHSYSSPSTLITVRNAKNSV